MASACVALRWVYFDLYNYVSPQIISWVQNMFMEGNFLIFISERFILKLLYYPIYDDKWDLFSQTSTNSPEILDGFWVFLAPRLIPSVCGTVGYHPLGMARGD